MKIALLLFITIPIVEMFILIEVGGLIGALPTIGLVVLTATLGVWLLRLEGIATLNNVRTKLENGAMPEVELLEGIMLLIGGALLLTPGFVTDAIGFTCLLPFLRRPIALAIITRIHTAMAGNASVTILQGEFQEADFHENDFEDGQFRENDGHNEQPPGDKRLD